MRFFFLNIVSWLEAHQIPCIIKSITHIDCPGCGLQRSFIALLKGSFAESIKLYPALFPILFLFIGLVINLRFKVLNGTNILKYSYIFCASIIMVSYIYKIINY